MWLASALASTLARALGNTKAQTYFGDEAAVVTTAAVVAAAAVEADEAGRIIGQSLTGDEGILVVMWLVFDGWLAAVCLFMNVDWSV